MLSTQQISIAWGGGIPRMFRALNPPNGSSPIIVPVMLLKHFKWSTNIDSFPSLSFPFLHPCFHFSVEPLNSYGSIPVRVAGSFKVSASFAGRFWQIASLGLKWLMPTAKLPFFPRKEKKSNANMRMTPFLSQQGNINSIISFYSFRVNWKLLKGSSLTMLKLVKGIAYYTKICMRLLI